MTDEIDAVEFGRQRMEADRSGQLYSGHWSADLRAIRLLIAEVDRLLAERTAAHADDATCASCTHEYVAGVEEELKSTDAENERLRKVIEAHLHETLIPGTDITWGSLLDKAPIVAWDEHAATLAFKEAWHKADSEGREGQRVRDGLRAVINYHAPVRLHRDEILLTLARADGQSWPFVDIATRQIAETMYGKQADAMFELLAGRKPE